MRTCVEVLAAQEKLHGLEAKIKTEYKSVFEGIPQLDELPDNVHCCIKLKDANKTIVTRAYSTLRKYKEAWSVLIQQHLDAGRI